MEHSQRRSIVKAGTCSGSIAVELLLLMLVLVPLVAGVFEFGRALAEYDTLVKSARAGARFYVTDGVGTITARKNKAACVVVHGNPGCTGTSVLPYLQTSMITVREPEGDFAMKSINACTPGSGVCYLDLISVSIVGYQFTPFSNLTFPQFTFNNISVALPYVY